MGGGATVSDAIAHVLAAWREMPESARRGCIANLEFDLDSIRCTPREEEEYPGETLDRIRTWRTAIRLLREVAKEPVPS